MPRPNEFLSRPLAAAREDAFGRRFDPPEPKDVKAMPYHPPVLSEESKVFLRVAATAWLNHVQCRVRRCRRDGRCIGRLSKYGMQQCLRGMAEAETEEMADFLSQTAELSTPEDYAARLARAKTVEEREMIEFRYWLFGHYHSELTKAGL